MSTETGLESRYDVRKINDPEGKHGECRYFVLDPEHDPLAREALSVYAITAHTHGYKALADDLHRWLADLATHPSPVSAGGDDA